MAARVRGVLMRFVACMRWIYGKISRRVGGSFMVILGLRWEMVPKVDSSRTCGVGSGTKGNFLSFV